MRIKRWAPGLALLAILSWPPGAHALQAVADVLAARGVSGPDLPGPAASAAPATWVPVAIGGGLLLLALTGAGLLALGLRRRVGR